MRWIAAVLIFIAFLICAGTHLLVTMMFLPRLNSQHLKFMQLKPKILADLKTVSGEPPFEETQFDKDVGLMLSQFVDWQGNDKTNPAAERVREFFLRHPYWRDYAGQYKKMIEDPDFELIDTEWMQSLTQYDHWNLADQPEMHSKLTEAGRVSGLERVTIWAKLPIPAFSDLRLWAILNFLKKRETGQGLLGLHTFRKVAQLAHSSGTLVGSMVAATMLKDEPFLAEHFKVSGWNSVSPEVVEAYRRVSWAWTAIAREPWFGDLPQELQPYFKTQFGMCAAAYELSAGASGIQDYLEPRFLFETDFREQIERVRKFQTELLKTCNMETYSAMVGPTAADAQRDLYTRIPFLRRVMGLMFMTVAMPNFLGIYER